MLCMVTVSHTSVRRKLVQYALMGTESYHNKGRVADLLSLPYCHKLFSLHGGMFHFLFCAFLKQSSNEFATLTASSNCNGHSLVSVPAYHLPFCDLNGELMNVPKKPNNKL